MNEQNYPSDDSHESSSPTSLVPPRYHDDSDASQPGPTPDADGERAKGTMANQNGHERDYIFSDADNLASDTSQSSSPSAVSSGHGTQMALCQCGCLRFCVFRSVGSRLWRLVGFPSSTLSAQL